MRRVYQVIFIATVTVLGLISLGVFSWLAARQWKRNFVALLGTVFLYVFVLTRASSIHHVDILLQWRILGWKWNWILELGGIRRDPGLGALIAMRTRGPSSRAAHRGWPRAPTTRLALDATRSSAASWSPDPRASRDSRSAAGDRTGAPGTAAVGHFIESATRGKP